jgi:hypothetical protein
VYWQGEIWQRNYVGHVLRDGKEAADASRYIAENPMMWGLDQENPERRIRFPKHETLNSP